MRRHRLPPDRHGGPVRATLDLVAPLAPKATDMHTREYSGAVSRLIGLYGRPGDVKSANPRSTPRTATILRLNPTKTILQPIARGIDFVGHVIKPWRRILRRRTVNESLRRIKTAPADSLFESANSYFGLLRQATHSHNDRKRLAAATRRRGLRANRTNTKVYRCHDLS